MLFQVVIMYTSAFATLIPPIVGTWKYKQYDAVFKLLVVYAILSVIGELVAIALVLTIRDNIFSYNIYIVVEAVLIMAMYYKLFQAKYAKLLAFTLITLAVAYKILVTINAPLGLNTPEDTFRTIVSFLVITSALYLFYQILKTYDSQDSLFASPVFWLNTAFLLYFMTNLFTFMVRNVMLEKLSDTLSPTFAVIHSFANILMNLLLALSFWLCRTVKK